MNKEEQFNFVEKYLDFKGEINADWKKYILLEKLLQSLDDSKRKGQILRSTPNTAPLICGAYNTQPEGLSTMA